MAETNYCVDTDIEGGSGDGSSWENAYSSSNLAEAGLQKDLDAVNEQMTVHCRASNGSADVLALKIDGWTTSAVDYLEWRAAATDKALPDRYNTSKYRIQRGNLYCININEDYVRIVDIQTQSTQQSTWNSWGIYINLVATTDIRIDSCYIKGVCSGTGSGCGIRASDSSVTVSIFNTIVTGFRSGEDTNFVGIQDDYTTGNVKVYNSIIHNCYLGCNRLGAVVNCAVFNNVDDFYLCSGIDHCASDDNDGTNNVAESGGGDEWPDDFIDALNGDFTKKATSGLVDSGVDDPGIGLYSDDMNGLIRVSPWDLGADEYKSILYKSVGDNGIGADAIVSVRVKLLLVDSGIGVDIRFIKKPFLITDSGSGIEIISISSWETEPPTMGENIVSVERIGKPKITSAIDVKPKIPSATSKDKLIPGITDVKGIEK